MGMYNALVVSSMMGCTISFTIPFALGVVSSLATSATAFGMMDRMDKKGVVMNSAFAV
ncbi:MAG: ethanolamine utilization protein EutH [Clostridia bacterium]|nr:ethanolamine utilization protein EutH [Clostridia bacterium]